MKATERRSGGRKSANLSLDADLLEEAKSLKINLSRAAEAGLAAAVSESKRERWLHENADALASSNAWVEERGLPLARFRRF